MKKWVDPSQPATFTSKRNIYGSKVAVYLVWDQKSIVYYKLLNPKETVIADRYRQ